MDRFNNLTEYDKDGKLIIKVSPIVLILIIGLACVLGYIQGVHAVTPSYSYYKIKKFFK